MTTKSGSYLAVFALLGSGEPTHGVGGNGQPNASAAYPFVGRVQDEATTPGTHICTGSLVPQRGNAGAPGIVLTASHCLNSNANINDEQHFERFQLPGGMQIIGLGVRHPAWSAPSPCPRPVSGNDVGLILLLNGPTMPLGTLVTGADPAMAVGNAVVFLGFTGSAAGMNPLLGNTTISAIPGGGQVYRYVGGAGANQNYIQGGDSGGPTLFNFGTMACPNFKIIGVHRSADATVVPRAFWDDVRVDAHLNFINEQGVGGANVINRLAGVADANWNVGATWSRGVAPPGTVPQNNDVAVLDPTNSGNVITVVSINGFATNTLEGLLNDVELRVNGNGNLRVTGFSGALSGGWINVGGATAGALNINTSLENANFVTLSTNATGNVGTTLAATTTQNRTNPNPPGNVVTADVSQNVAVRNDAASVFDVDGGTLNVPVRFDNLGTLRVRTGGNAAIGASLPAMMTLFSNPPPSVATTTVAPIAVQNSTGAMVKVEASSVLNVRNGANRTSLFVNQSGASLMLEGTFFNAQGVANLDALKNQGNVVVDGNGRLNIDRPIGAGPMPRLALDNQAGSTFRVNAQGTATLRGNSQNDGTVQIDGTSARLEIMNSAAFEQGRLTNLSGRTIAFSGPNDPFEQEIAFDGANFRNEGIITGEGLLYFTNSVVSFANAASLANNAGMDMNHVAVVFANATAPLGGDGFVTMETTSEDLGAVEAGLGTPFALARLCVAAPLGTTTKVRLVDSFSNETTNTEVLYVRQFGINGGSTLDLNGKTLYYLEPDPSCGGIDMNRVVANGGQLVQIHVPGDCNADAHVNLDDYSGFPACIAGPTAPAPMGCACHDLDIDGDVDLLDVAEFQMAFTG